SAQRRLVTGGYHNIRFARRKFAKARVIGINARCLDVFEGEIAIPIPQLCHALSKGDVNCRITRLPPDKADTQYPYCLLRPRDKRASGNTATEQRDEIAPVSVEHGAPSLRQAPPITITTG